MDGARRPRITHLLFGLLVMTLAGGLAVSPVRAGKLDPILTWIRIRWHPNVDLAPVGRYFAVYRGEAPVPPVLKRPLSWPESPTSGEPAPVRASSAKFSVFVVTDDPGVLNRVGSRPLTVAGPVVTARLTLDQINALADLPQVRHIRLGRRLKPLLDRSVPEVGAKALQSAPPFLRGQGVISGAVDTGIAHLHRDFRVDRDPADGVDEESSRILWIWDQMPGQSYFDGFPMPCGTDPGDPCPPEQPPVGYDYGTEYSRAQIEADIRNGVATPYEPEAQVPHVDDYGHGTHVMGIQASDGSSKPEGYPHAYVGMAPDSDLIMVRTTLFDTDIVDGVAYIFGKAQQLGRPAVVNLSLGGHFGPHDGTDPFDLAISALAGPGRIIVAAAGNEGDLLLHANDEVSGPGDVSELTFTILDGVNFDIIDGWYSRSSRFTIQVVTPGGFETVPFPYGTEGALFATPDGCVFVYNAAPPAGVAQPPLPPAETVDNQAMVVVFGEEPEAGCPLPAAAGEWTIRFTGEQDAPGGRYDAWSLMSWVEGEDVFLPPLGNSEMTVGSPGTARQVITVGAYVTRTEWQDRRGELRRASVGAIGDHAYFTSRGPTRDLRQKPEVAAPGAMIAATASKESQLYQLAGNGLVLPDGEHMVLAGTSMATPHVSGLVAQLLQVVPGLSTADVSDLLTSTARSDTYTGLTPNSTWGHGKISATRAYAAEAGPRQLAIKVGPNPARETATFYYTLDRRYDSARLLVYTVAGKRVYEQPLESEVGSHYVTWNLADRDGRPLANGLYLFVLEAGQSRATGKLLIAR